jgi:hypothetical protein
VDLPNIFVDPSPSLAKSMTWVFLLAPTILLSFTSPELALDLVQFPPRFLPGNSSFTNGLFDFTLRMAVTLHERIVVPDSLFFGLQIG